MAREGINLSDCPTSLRYRVVYLLGVNKLLCVLPAEVDDETDDCENVLVVVLSGESEEVKDPLPELYVRFTGVIKGADRNIEEELCFRLIGGGCIKLVLVLRLCCGSLAAYCGSNLGR